eukprot:35095-Pyramimonas_sp.AAC.1
MPAANTGGLPLRPKREGMGLGATVELIVNHYPVICSLSSVVRYDVSVVYAEEKREAPEGENEVEEVQKDLSTQLDPDVIAFFQSHPNQLGSSLQGTPPLIAATHHPAHVLCAIALTQMEGWLCARRSYWDIMKDVAVKAKWGNTWAYDGRKN